VSRVLELTVIFRPTPETLEDLIGPPCERSWNEDFEPAASEGMEALGQSLQMYPYMKVRFFRGRLLCPLSWPMSVTF
jgi:hypothetical protein